MRLRRHDFKPSPSGFDSRSATRVVLYEPRKTASFRVGVKHSAHPPRISYTVLGKTSRMYWCFKEPPITANLRESNTVSSIASVGIERARSAIPNDQKTLDSGSVPDELHCHGLVCIALQDTVAAESGFTAGPLRRSRKKVTPYACLDLKDLSENR